MGEIIFILGKNPELSIAEILSYLSARGIISEILAKENEFLALKLPEEKIQEIKIEDLGGTIKICRILDVSGSIKEDFEIENIFDLKKEKIIFGLSFYNIKSWQTLYTKIGKHLKQKLKEAGIKSGYFHLPENRGSLTHVEVIKKNLLENGEAVFCFSNGKYYIGKTIQVHNPFEFQKRDIGRPEQRAIFSIPPRLAKIMANLLAIRSGTILDPFCGIGTILQEASLMGFEIRGVDLDKNCVISCRKNLEWLKKEYSIELKELDKKIINKDSKNLSKYFEKESIDGIVTEPYLGPPLKKYTDRRKAEKILSVLEELYTGVLSQCHKILKAGGRVCIISPRIKLATGTISLDVKNICKKTNFKLLHIYTDSEERHRLIREINVLEKI